MGVAADDEEAAPINNYGADAVAFASALLVRGDITDEEGASPKENLLTAVAAPAEATIAGVVAANGPK